MPATTRRRFLQTSALTFAAAHLAPHTVLAQAVASAPPTDRLAQMRASAASAKITTQPLRGGVSALLGSGGNMAVLPGKDGKLLVDAGFATSRAQITEALDKLGRTPVTLLINTHWHFDHTDGNEWLHGEGATITAHRNTRQRLSTTQQIADYGLTIPPSPAGALPTDLVDATHTMHRNSETLSLAHFEPAHTDTDLSVYFANADILHTGDTWFNGIYPFFDYSSGGSIDGMIRAAKRNLALATRSTLIVPGHGPIGDRVQLQAFFDMLVGSRDKIAALKKQGRTVEEVVAARPTAAFDATFKPLAGPDFFPRLVYKGV